jgi:hypothetical protein
MRNVGQLVFWLILSGRNLEEIYTVKLVNVGFYPSLDSDAQRMYSLSQCKKIRHYGKH